MKVLSTILVLVLGIGCRTNESPEQQVNDAKITASVKSKLAGELGASTVTNISVNVTNGVVTLAGTVHDSAEKSKAIAISQGVPKVVRVNDNLQIPPTPSGRQSSTLRDAVQLVSSSAEYRVELTSSGVSVFRNK